MRQGNDHAEERVLRVAASNIHVQVVQALAQHLHDPRRDITYLGVLESIMLAK